MVTAFSVPSWSSHALFAGTHSLRYCATRIAGKVPIWRLPVSGHVSSLVTADPGVADDGEAEVAGQEFHWVSVSGPGRKRIRLTTLRGWFSSSISATCVEEVASFGAFSCFL